MRRSWLSFCKALDLAVPNLEALCVTPVDQTRPDMRALLPDEPDTNPFLGPLMAIAKFSHKAGKAVDRAKKLIATAKKERQFERGLPRNRITGRSTEIDSASDLAAYVDYGKLAATQPLPNLLADLTKKSENAVLLELDPSLHEERLSSPKTYEDLIKMLFSVREKELPQALHARLRQLEGGTYLEQQAFADRANDDLSRLGWAIGLPGANQPSILVAEQEPGSDSSRFRLQAATAEGQRADLPEKFELVRADLQRVHPGRWAELVRPSSSLASPYDPLPPVAQGPWQEVAGQVLATLKNRLLSMPHETYDDKKKLTAWVNAELGRVGLAVKCPSTGRPSILVAGSSRSTESRILVQHKGDNGKSVRSFSTKELATLLDKLELMPPDPEKSRWGRWAQHPAGRHGNATPPR